jgi:hypothetical protein
MNPASKLSCLQKPAKVEWLRLFCSRAQVCCNIFDTLPREVDHTYHRFISGLGEAPIRREMPPTLQHVFDLKSYHEKNLTLSLGPIKGGAHRYCVAVSSGSLTSSGLSFSHVQGGSDWLLLETVRGIAHLDVRTYARNADSASIYMHYPSILKMDEATQKCSS